LAPTGHPYGWRACTGLPVASSCPWARRHGRGIKILAVSAARIGAAVEGAE
jgi:hypothetical protein